MLDLNDKAASALGHSFIERMNGRGNAVLKIGAETFTRHQLVRQIGTGNFRAARILSDTCSRLGLHSVKDLYNISPYSLAAEEGLGVTTLFVLMALFAAKGLDPYRWFFGKGKQAEAAVTFDTLKHQAAKRDIEAKKTEKALLKRNNAIAHNKRTGTFLRAGSKKGKVIDLPAALEDQLQATGSHG